MTTPTLDLPIKPIPEKLADLQLVDPSWDWRCGRCDTDTCTCGSPTQRETAQAILDAPTKIVMLEAECGSGKSIIPLAAARSQDWTASVLIQTTNLQRQYLRDFADAKMIMSRRHSVCNLSNNRADRAPCVADFTCALQGKWRKGEPPLERPQCNYFALKWDAVHSDITIHNYAYWLQETKGRSSYFAESDMIICDEGHKLDEVLMDAGTVEIRPAVAYRLGMPTLPSGADFEELVSYAEDNQKRLREIQTALATKMDGYGVGTSAEFLNFSVEVEATISQVSAAKRMAEALSFLRGMKSVNQRKDWVVVWDTRGSVCEIRPIYGKYAFDRLESAATKKLVIMSAYLGPKLLMQSLGLNPEDVTVIEAPNAFKRDKSRIYFCPVVKLSYNSPPADYNFMFRMLDRIIAQHPSEKGLIHVPSMKLRDQILKASTFRSRMLAYDGASVADPDHADKETVVQAYVRSKEPKILLGQSISTGLDLPHVPKWQVIVKMSFPPTNNPAIAKRMKIDPAFYTYLTICEIVQAAGRIKRARDHDGPTYILDANFKWFYGTNVSHFPQWFRKAIVFNGWDKFPEVAAMLKQERSRSFLGIGKPVRS